MGNEHDMEFEVDVMTLMDEEGNEHQFEIIDKIEDDRGCFYALLPYHESEEEILEEETYYIFKMEEVEDGDNQLIEVSDETLLNELADEFEARYEAKFTEDEE